MLTLSHSAFLQALGYAIINSLWQMALLWIVVVLLNSLFSFSSNARYRIALTAQFAGFAWFVFTLQFYFTKCLVSIQELKGIDVNAQKAFLAQQTVENFNTKIWNAMLHLEQTLPYLSIAYILLLCVLSFKWIRSYKYTLEIKRHGILEIDDKWSDFVSDMVAHLNIKSEVSIFASTLVNSPLTVGFWKPVILIPIASVNHLTVQQLEAVILHELAHIRRMDYLLNIFLSIIEISLFFNPFTLLIGRFIKKEREHSCDDWVLQFKYNPAMYAEALLQLAYLNTSRTTLAMPAKGSKGDLVSRVKRMLNQKEQTFTYRHQILAFLLMTSILSSIAWFSPAKVGKQAASVTSSKTIIVAPVTAKVDNPLFNPVFFLNEPMKKEITNKVEESARIGVNEAMKGLVEAKAAMKDITPMVMTSLEKSKEAIANINVEDINNQVILATDAIKNMPFISGNAFSVNVDSIQNVARKEWDRAKFQWSKDKIEVEIMNAKTEMAKVKALKWLSKEDQANIQKSMDMAIKELDTIKVNFNFNYDQVAPDPARVKARPRRTTPDAPPPPAPPKGAPDNHAKWNTEDKSFSYFNLDKSDKHFDLHIDTIKHFDLKEEEDPEIPSDWEVTYPVYIQANSANVSAHVTSKISLPALCNLIVKVDGSKEDMIRNKKIAQLVRYVYVTKERKLAQGSAAPMAAPPAPSKARVAEF